MSKPITITIPQTTFGGTPQTFAHSIPTGLVEFQISLDVSQLDPNTPEAQRAQISIVIERSDDGGITWPFVIATKLQPGGSTAGDWVNGQPTFTTTAYIDAAIGGDPANAQRWGRATVKTVLADGVTPGPSFVSSGGSLSAQ